MIKPYNKKSSSRATKTPKHTNASNTRGDKVASNIVKSIFVAKIGRINSFLPNMVVHNLFQ